jgi:hypothetical protein
MRIPRHGQPEANRYFLPCKRQDSGIFVRLSLPTVAPGHFPGALRFVSLALHVLPHKDGRRRSAFQRGKLPTILLPETHTQKLTVNLLTQQPTHGTQQAWMNSRNQTTITISVDLVNHALKKVVVQFEFRRGISSRYGVIPKTRVFSSSPPEERLRSG